MTIGGSLALIIIGAILAYAVEFSISGLDIEVVGVILMIGGLVGLVFGVARLASTRRRTVVRPARPAHYEEEVTYEDRRPRY
ncbi:hypothetical protein DPM19_24755 [Actinomadura craniellae]|uniref:DUF6458 domain-containing protein n=1 Tax=Actinomadura craniellae TaxID=2231787 RepID=A0A365GZU7_9ACTN|nr:DUF6458 family protein [Actinomadura craniellae]RAY12365.1 hypothetical protein DPM19_24755 [Actinomadura craniellae]